MTPPCLFSDEFPAQYTHMISLCDVIVFGVIDIEHKYSVKHHLVLGKANTRIDFTSMAALSIFVE